MKTDESTISALVIPWAEVYGRHNLPWQIEPTPYRVWISEIMLQQTQVATVKSYFNSFLTSFPDLQTLAKSNLDTVLRHWSGLGYYARARNLHKTANMLVTDHEAAFPNSVDILQTLPGIGKSTAGAIVSIAFQKRAAILDANVKRVIARFHAVSGWPGHTKTKKRLWALAESILPDKNYRRYSQAMMDLGALICTSKKPDCKQCPLRDSCAAATDGRPEKYPGKRPKRKPMQRQTTFLIMFDDKERILLCRRPAKGIWGGLWCFPESCSDHPNEIETTLKPYGITNFRVTQKQPVLKHTFTHFQLEIQPLILRVARSQSTKNCTVKISWLRKNERHKYGFPVPVKILLDSLGFS